jgi:tetratricopeptide (TPR) repeat protein
MNYKSAFSNSQHDDIVLNNTCWLDDSVNSILAQLNDEQMIEYVKIKWMTYNRDYTDRIPFTFELSMLPCTNAQCALNRYLFEKYETRTNPSISDLLKIKENYETDLNLWLLLELADAFIVNGNYQTGLDYCLEILKYNKGFSKATDLYISACPSFQIDEIQKVFPYASLCHDVFVDYSLFKSYLLDGDFLKAKSLLSLFDGVEYLDGLSKVEFAFYSGELIEVVRRTTHEIESDPMNSTYYSFLIWATYHLKKDEVLLKYAEKISITVEARATLLTLSGVYFAFGLKDRAVEVLKRLDFSEDQILVVQQLALLVDQSKRKLNRSDFERLITTNPDGIYYLAEVFEMWNLSFH